MKKFILLSFGFKPPTPEMMDAWRKWFASIGNQVVDPGNPLGPGREVNEQGVKELSVDMQAITGYTIINAESMADAVKIAEGCPVVASMRVYEAMPM